VLSHLLLGKLEVLLVEFNFFCLVFAIWVKQFVSPTMKVVNHDDLSMLGNIY
jgi:hypothetical protein